MADFSIKTTNIQAPDLSAASHVSPGVVDQSQGMREQNKAGAIDLAGKLGTEAYKGYQEAQINTATQDTIQQYMSTRDSLLGIKHDVTDSQKQETLFANQQANLSPAEIAQKQKLAIYQKALSEGVMTPDEFSDRVLANLREATNRNPGLFNELKTEAARVLELSGITGIVKSDKLLLESKQQQAAKLMEDMQARARKENIYYDVTTQYWDLAKQVGAAEQSTRAYNLQVRGADQFKMLSQSQARSWVENNGNDVVRGGLQAANTSVFNMIDQLGITSDTYPKYKAQISAQFDNLKSVFSSSIPVNIRQDPLVQENLKTYNDGLDSILKRFDNLASGEDLKKVATNEFELLKMSQDTNLRRNVDVSSLELSTKLAASVPGIVTQNPEYRQKLFDASVAISQGNFQSPAIKSLIPASDKDNKSASLINGAIALGTQTKSYTAFSRTLDAVNNQIDSIDNPKVRLQFMYNNLAAIANQPNPLDLDVATISKVETSVSKLLNDPTYGLSTLKDTTAGMKVKMDVLPSGHLIFTGEDATKFNATYANNVNTALRAYANAHNTSMALAAKRFYPQYFGTFFTPQSTK